MFRRVILNDPNGIWKLLNRQKICRSYHSQEPAQWSTHTPHQCVFNINEISIYHYSLTTYWHILPFYSLITHTHLGLLNVKHRTHSLLHIQHFALFQLYLSNSTMYYMTSITLIIVYLKC